MTEKSDNQKLIIKIFFREKNLHVTMLHSHVAFQIFVVNIFYSVSSFILCLQYYAYINENNYSCTLKEKNFTYTLKQYESHKIISFKI